MRPVPHSPRGPIDRLIARVGGPERAKMIFLLAATLGLDGADKGAIGAMAGPLEKGLGIGKTEVGLLVSLTLAVGALATLPFGWWVDRFARIRLLAWAIVFWGVAMILGGTATSYLYLLITRLGLAGVSGCVLPATASLLGDVFTIDQRARVYGYVLVGEFVGTGLGYLIAGELANWTWRAGLIVLGIPAFFLAWWLSRTPEPPRASESRPRAASEGAAPGRKVFDLARAEGIRPREALLLTRWTLKQSPVSAFLYVLRVPTSLVLILASAFGYFFLSGIRAFGAQYMNLWFGVSHATAVLLVLMLGVGAVGGVLFSGWLADALIARGHLRGRVNVGAIAYVCTCGLLLVGFLMHPLWVAMLWLFGAAFALGAINPPLDAARLDIMYPGLWGRSEAIRTLLRKLGEAVGPLAFGYVAEHFFGSRSAEGLHDTFLLMLVPLVIGLLIGLIALRTYPRDIATADENARREQEMANA